jgi:hypothetical protein
VRATCTRLTFFSLCQAHNNNNNKSLFPSKLDRIEMKHIGGENRDKNNGKKEREK